MAEVARTLGRALAAYHLELEGALWADLEASGVFAGVPAGRARREWECLALHACVRGIVAAAGFNDSTADAVDGMHEIVLEGWAAGPAAEERRERLSARYAEYGRIGQELDSDGADAISEALARAAAAHVFDPAKDAPAAAVETIASLHGAMTEGAAEVVRRCAAAGA